MGTYQNGEWGECTYSHGSSLLLFPPPLVKWQAFPQSAKEKEEAASPEVVRRGETAQARIIICGKKNDPKNHRLSSLLVKRKIIPKHA